ncbi:MAG: argininosuccinate lyase [Acidimicrobiales bacterium]|nr:argininosuccinate lyase [Acidimicrobiales bacterium]
MTLWQARMGDSPNAALLAFTQSLSFDHRIYKDDIQASIAHVSGLERSKIITSAEAETLIAGLKRVSQEIEEGKIVFIDTDEDIHTVIERRVKEICGDVGGKLHTGRSRNDQVSTALRLYLRRELKKVGTEVISLARVLLKRSEEDPTVYLPGYTHLQRAQPVLLAHHLLAHGWALLRDVDRLIDAVDRLNISPLGAGALAGSSLPLDPDKAAEDLGFKKRFDNSIDAVSDRDFVAESLFVISMIGIHLSRIGEEVAMWSSAEFGFMTLDDAFSTGSSMLPQKKNPDIAELARGKAGRLIGNLTGFLATLKGLPLSYNRDLQEDKEPIFDAIDQISLALHAIAGLMDSATFNSGAMSTAADAVSSAAIDLAEWLVIKGMPFREAYTTVGMLVRDSTERHVPLEELVASHPDLGDEAVELLLPGSAVKRRTTPGGAGPKVIQQQIDAYRDCLINYSKTLNS